MNTAVDLKTESETNAGFYVPAFKVEIDKVGLPRDVLLDVIQITYKDNTKEIDSFELTVNNWDPEKNTFKYVGSETRDSIKKNPLHSLFLPCSKEVKVSMGYIGNMRVMLTGNFTTMEPSFTSGGGPTLTVRGLNVLHTLRRKQNSRSWENKKDSQIVKSIESSLKIDVAINEKSMRNVEERLKYVAQRNQYDIDFILSRALRLGYVVLVQEKDKNVPGSKKRIYFGPSEENMPPGLRDVTFELAWGKSLIDFRPTLTTANQIKSVTVNGWNRKTKKPISVTVNLDDKKLNRNQDLYEVLKKCDPREGKVVDKPVFTRKEARNLAIAILKEKQKDMVKASGTTVGLPDLRAGKKVKIDGVGVRFNGTYFITETTHTINDGGYTTKFCARREDEGKKQ